MLTRNDLRAFLTTELFFAPEEPPSTRVCTPLVANPRIVDLPVWDVPVAFVGNADAPLVATTLGRAKSWALHGGDPAAFAWTVTLGDEETTGVHGDRLRDVLADMGRDDMNDATVTLGDDPTAYPADAVWVAFFGL